MTFEASVGIQMQDMSSRIAEAVKIIATLDLEGVVS